MAPQLQRPPPADAFDAVKAVGLTLLDVEATIRYDGSPVLKAGGRFMAGVAAHRSAEPGTLVVRVGLGQRGGVLEGGPGTHYVTDHYRQDPPGLVLPLSHDWDARAQLL